MTPLRRTASLLVVLAMLLTMTAIPAFAAATGSATITTGDLLSGKSGLVTVNIENTATGGVVGTATGSTTINAFTIEVPQDVVDVGTVTLPDGWEGGYDDEIGFVFASRPDADGDGKLDGGIAPGDDINVDFNVDADAIPDDRTGRFTTFVSDNGGATLSEAGAPEVTSRILEIVTATIRKPPAAPNKTVTEVTAEQRTSYYSITVRNHGTEDRSVTVDGVRTGGSSNTLTTKTNTRPITAGAVRNIWVSTTFGNAGTLNSKATAVSTNSAAKPLDLAPITVQAKFAANFKSNSLSPKAVAQGATTDISLSINKTAGAQPVAGTACFAFSTFETCTDLNVDAANGEKLITFEDVVIPTDLLNGEYSSTLTLTGQDGNGANVAVTLDTGIITLDNLLPVVNITAHVGEPDVPGAAPATTNGRTVTFSGSIGLSEGTAPCTTCSVTKAVFVALPSGTELPINLTNNDGTLSGSQSFTFPPGTTSAFATVTAVRTTGAEATGTDLPVTVDLIRPTLGDPGLTSREAANDVIFINLLDDGLLMDAADSSPSDWMVDNNAVVRVVVEDVVGSPQAGAATSVKLVLQSRLGDNDTPTVTYSPLLGTRIHDRVSLTIADASIDTVDGIIPTAPVIETVGGFGRQPDEFHTNDATPDVALTDLVVGNLLEIYVDTNDDGTLDISERKFAGQIEAESATVTLSTLSDTALEGVQLVARMKDDAGNIGLADTGLLNLDFTPATLVDFTVDGNQVTVIFSEPIARGRDAAFDWTINATDGSGRTANRTVTSVGAGSDLTQRVLTVSSSSWDGTGDVNSARYKFRGAEADRYQDRATNLLVDASVSK